MQIECDKILEGAVGSMVGFTLGFVICDVLEYIALWWHSDRK